MTPQRRRILIIGAPILVVVLVVGFLLFRPDTLFFDNVVEEDLGDDVAALVASPTPTQTPTPSDTASAPAAPTPDPTPTTSSPSPSPAATTAQARPPADGPVVLARGSWTSLEHTTTGTVVLLRDGDDLQLVLADLDGSNGPDLQVILSPKKAIEGDWFGYEEGATYLGALKGNKGTQTYDVPDDLDLDGIASVVIWCERFSVGFGAADLVAAT